MARVSQKGKIIEAAEKLISRDGAAHLTLDAVAEAAGVSKGGLLYHFKNKNELIQAILQAYIQSNIDDLEEQQSRLSESEECNELEAHLKAFIDVLHGSASSRQTGVALLAVIANNPELLQPFQEVFDAKADRIWGKRNSFNADAAILWLAAEGLRFFSLMSHDPFQEGQREKVIKRLLALAKEHGKK